MRPFVNQKCRRNEIFFKKEEGEALKAELGLAGKTVYAYMPTW